MHFSPSRPVPFSQVPQWDESTDVLIVGLGAAGACAAIESARAGASVLVLERAAAGGGTTALAGGHLYLGGGTAVQQACGFEDSAEDMYRYLMATATHQDAAKARLYADQSVAHFDWLVAQGIPFRPTFHPHRTSLQLNDDCLIFTGNERQHPYASLARPAPRGHKAAADYNAGPLIMEKLIAAAGAAGARMQYQTNVLALIRDERYRIQGVVAEQDGRTRYLRARRGVILCAGGFVMNREMLTQYAPQLLPTLPNGNPFDDGIGIRLGAGAGGATIHMAEMFITLPYYPPESLTFGLLVNGAGQRFINEDAYHGAIGDAAFRQPEGKVFLIADDENFALPEINGVMEMGGVPERIAEVATANTLAGLEAALALPAGTLQATVDTYNRFAAEGRDPLFQKTPKWLRALNKPPFHALDCSVGVAPYMTFTLGGLHALPSGEVLDADGDPVPGLFAAGRTTCGLSRSAWGYSSGLSLGDATFFGRLAGRQAAATLPTD